MAEKHALKRTAVVGLGGTGLKAVLYMKKRLLEAYGKIPPMFSFLVIDTTDADVIKGGPKGDISLEQGEFLKIPVRDPANLIQSNSEVRDWLDEARVPKFALSSGAKQVRMLGRLAVFANAKDIDAKITQLISNVRDFSIDRNDEFDISGDYCTVNLVCSLSGGTGAGSFLDVTAMVREHLGALDKLVGYFLLPDIFIGKPATENVAPNAYGALREISHFMGMGAAAYKYKLGGKERKFEAPYNAIYLVNKTNFNNVEFNNQNDLNEVLGVGMFMQSTSTGKATSDVIDNVEGRGNLNWFGKATVFSSFGIGELVYPGAAYAEIFAHQIALDTLQSVFLGGNVTGLDAAIDDFVRVAAIRENDADDLVNALGDPSDVTPFPFPKPPFKKETIAEVVGKRTTHLERSLRDVQERIAKNLAALKEEKLKKVRDEVAARAAQPQGLEYARAFCQLLAGKLEAYKTELAGERDGFEKDMKGMDGRYQHLQDEAQTAAKSLFGGSTKIETALRTYAKAVDHHARLQFEHERHEKAIDLFVHLLKEIGQLQAQLSGLSGVCQALVGVLGQRVHDLEADRRKAARPFAEELAPAEPADAGKGAGPADFLNWLRDEKKTDVLSLGSLIVEDLKGILLEYSRGRESVEAARVRTIEDILGKLPEEGRLHYVSRLNDMAAPLWQYNQGDVAGDKTTITIHLFGVQDAGKTVFNPQQIAKGIATSTPPLVVSTGLPQSVVCFKVETAVPACVVHDLHRYYEKYANKERPFPYHVKKDWDLDLTPMERDVTPSEEARKWWSLANAFKVIGKEAGGTTYQMKSLLRGDRFEDNVYKLGDDRALAMSKFLDDSGLVQETMQKIKELTKAIGDNKKVAEQLEAWDKVLVDAVHNQPESRRLLEMEIKDIETYHTDLMKV